jgi:hypothetical protein
LGGAGHASPLLNDAILLNPSFSAFLVNRVSFSGHYQWFESAAGSQANGTAIPEKGRAYQLAIQDGRSEWFQAGLAYTQREDGSMIHIGAAKTLVARTGFGLGAKFLFDPERKSLGTDLTFSATAIPAKDLQLALIVDNLLQGEEAKRRGMLREVILGTKFNVLGMVLLYFDPHYVPDLPDTQKYGHEMGVEVVVASDIFLRAGTYRNSTVPFLNLRGNGMGYGIGYIAPKLSIDFGITRNVEPFQSTAYVLGATMYL